MPGKSRRRGGRGNNHFDYRAQYMGPIDAPMGQFGGGKSWSDMMYDYTWGMLNPWQQREIIEKAEDEEKMTEEKQKIADAIKETQRKVTLTPKVLDNISKKPGSSLTYKPHKSVGKGSNRSTVKLPILV